MLWTEATFNLEVHIPGADAGAVRAHLLANKHWTHHPLIVSWHETAPGEYQIVDKVPMFGMMMRVSYRSKVTALDETTIQFEGFQPMVYVDNRTSIHPAPDGCIVREAVKVRTLSFLKRFVLAQAYESHKAMLENLKHESYGL